MHDRQWYSNFGPLSRALEQRLLEQFGRPHETVVVASNATAGLSAALLATRRPGPVLAPAFTFPASLGAIKASALDPIIADVDEDLWSFRADALDRALIATGATIVMLVAPFGLSRDFEAEIAVCRNRGVSVVIDNAAGLGGPRSPTGLPEDVFEVFSMHATKPFGVGEGGAIFAHSGAEQRLRSALNFGFASEGGAGEAGWGFNGKMSEMHAAVGLAQAARFERVLCQRQAFAADYIARLAPRTDLVFPTNPASAPWQFFPVLLPHAEAAERFVDVAAKSGVEIRRYYRPSLSTWPGVATLAPCPVSEDLAKRMCVLPVRSGCSSELSETLKDLTIGALESAL